MPEPCRVSFDGYISARDAARVLDVSLRTLSDWRLRCYGPPAEWRALWGSKFRYALTDVYQHILDQALRGK